MKNKFALFLLLALLISCSQQGVTEKSNQNAAVNVRNAEILKSGNASGIETSDINYGNASGFLAKPKAGGIYPGVVMIHEWWGLNDNIREMARQLAAEGYVVLAVDLFDGQIAKDANQAREFSAKVRDNEQKALNNLKSAVGYIRKQDSVFKDKIGSIGWCFGGGYSLQLALNEKMSATVIYYGSLETDQKKLYVIKWPVLGIFGDKDTSIPVESVNQFRNSLNNLKVPNEIHIYEGVGHAFANPSGMNYAPEQTKDAWKKTIDFFQRNLK